MVVKRGLGVLVGEVVGIDFVQRGGQGFFKVEFGAVEIGLGGFVFPLHGLPVEERQVDGGGATQERDIERAFGFFRRRAQARAQCNRGIPTAFLRFDGLERGLQAVFGGAKVGAVSQYGNRYVEVHAFDGQQAVLRGVGGDGLVRLEVEQVA